MSPSLARQQASPRFRKRILNVPEPRAQQASPRFRKRILNVPEPPMYPAASTVCLASSCDWSTRSIATVSPHLRQPAHARWQRWQHTHCFEESAASVAKRCQRCQALPALPALPSAAKRCQRCRALPALRSAASAAYAANGKPQRWESPPNRTPARDRPGRVGWRTGS
jgi:hypothetical protein